MTEKNVQGFTLIEALITIAILGIVASLAIPSYQYAIKKTRRADAKIALSELAQAQEAFYTDMRTYASDLGDVAGASTIRCRYFCREVVNTNQGISPEGYYQLDIGPRTTTSSITTGFRLTATALGPQYEKDKDCRTFTLDSIGNKRATDAGGNPNDNCW